MKISLQQIAFTEYVSNLLEGTIEASICEEKFLKKSFNDLQQCSTEVTTGVTMKQYKYLFMKKLKEFYYFLRSVQYSYSKFAIDILELNMMNHIIHTVECIKIVMTSFHNSCIILRDVTHI
jgi:hypothetical protein